MVGTIILGVLALLAITIFGKAIKIIGQAEVMVIERWGRFNRVARSGFNVLIPFMEKEVHADGDVLFRAGDVSDKMYLIREGAVHLVEVNRELGPDTLFGEIGIVSSQNLRTATAVCKGPCVLLSIDQEHVLELYFQAPEFGFYLMRLVTDRRLHNLDVADGGPVTVPAR